MSKLSFRARAIDANKPISVYKADEIPELLDFAAVNRAVLEMPTGMEKEEETEHHLQRALSAQQVYGTAEALVIPIPEVDAVGERYAKLYGSKGDFRISKQYIHVQPFGMDQEIPEYDMDSEDEVWLNRQVKHLKMDVPPIKFESMMDRLEKGSGQMVVTLNEAKALLKVDDDLIIAVYDYWLNKRLRLQHPLIPQVKTEKRDGTTTNNPYVAFRRRTEKMQTRKNRKNDEVSYEKMLKLRKDLNKALSILELLKRREKCKKELLKLTVEVAEKRYQMQDWDGKLLAEANAKKHTLPSFFPITHRYMVSRDWESAGSGAKESAVVPRKKREYKKRKHKQPASVVPVVTPATQPAAVHLPNYVDMGMLHHRGARAVSSDDDVSGGSQSEHEGDTNDPDGVYAFRRMAGCSYLAPRSVGQTCWPWSSTAEGGLGKTPYRYALASLPVHDAELPTASTDTLRPELRRQRCVGYIRQRIGRGGRVLFDRAFSEWDNNLKCLNVEEIEPETVLSPPCEYLRHIQANGIPLYRRRVQGRQQRTVSDVDSGFSSFGIDFSPLILDGFRQNSDVLRHNQQQQQRPCRLSTDELIDVSDPPGNVQDVVDSNFFMAASSSACSGTDIRLTQSLSSAVSWNNLSSSAITNGSVTTDSIPLAVKSYSNSTAVSHMPTVSVPVACDGGLNATAALPFAVDNCTTSFTASVLLTDSAQTDSSQVTLKNSLSNTLGGQVTLTVGRKLDSSNSCVALPDGSRFVTSAPLPSLPNHSTACRDSSPTTCRPASLALAPGLKLAASTQLNIKDAVARENHDGVSATDQTAFIMEVT